jgi:hypothetical protein
MAAKSLTALRDVVEADLVDAANSVWSTAEIDRAIRKALFRYSEIRPQQAIGTLAAAASREYSLTTLTGLLDVQRVWFPYDSSDPSYPPRWVEFELWDDKTILFLKVDECPAVGDDPLRVFYTKWHTLTGLDTAAVSTYFEEDEEVLVVGACAFAAIERTRYVVDTVNPTVETPAMWDKWGKARLREFEDGLQAIARRMIRYMDSRVGVELEI